jgi:imidazolonepropionase-like amidohydrolase
MEIKKRSILGKGIAFVVFLLVFMAAVNAFGGGDFGEVYAVKAGRIVTVTQGVIENGTVLIRDGIIEAVGIDVPIPPDAEVIEADTMFVYPGLIDAHTSLALTQPTKPGKSDQTQQRQLPAITVAEPSASLLKADLLAVDLLNPKDGKIAKIRETGITTLLTIPDKGIFIGQSGLINLAGENAGEMIVKSPVAMHLAYQRQTGAYPATLMAVIAYQRQTLLDARHHKLVWDRYQQQKKGRRRPLPNKSLDALIPILEGRLPIIISANEENEIKRTIKLAEEFGLNYIISGAAEGWRVVDLLKSEQRPILVSLNFPKPKDVTGYAFKLKIEGPSKKTPEKEKEKPEKKEEKEKVEKEKKEEDPEKAEIYANAGALHKAGIKFAFTSGGLKKPADFIKNAAKAIEQGLPKDEALKALTINPAEIFGVADQVGSVEEGKIANLFVTTGDLFDEKTKVKIVFVDGKKFEVKERKIKGEEPSVDVTGTWDASVKSPDGETAFTLILKQSGSQVTGELKSEMGTASIEDGSVSGNNITFTVSLDIGGQNVEMSFSGTVEENTIEGTIDMGPMGTAEWEAEKPGI